MRFDGKVVMISGAASGFGRLAAQRFAAEGARFGATAWQPERTSSLKSQGQQVECRRRNDYSAVRSSSSKTIIELK